MRMKSYSSQRPFAFYGSQGRAVRDIHNMKDTLFQLFQVFSLLLH